MKVHRSWFKGLSAFGGFKVKGSMFNVLSSKVRGIVVIGYSLLGELTIRKYIISEFGIRWSGKSPLK